MCSNASMFKFIGLKAVCTSVFSDIFNNKIISVTKQASLLYPSDIFTMLTEVVCFISNVQQIKHHLLLNGWLIRPYVNLVWQEFTICFVIKATFIRTIDGNGKREAG